MELLATTSHKSRDIALKDKVTGQIEQSNFISRDLSWVQFNYRVLDQSKKEDRSIFEKLKFLAITASNLDEFFMIRVGSLYNYIEYERTRIDYSGLRELPFRDRLFDEIHKFEDAQYTHFVQNLEPHFHENGFRILKPAELNKKEKNTVSDYFQKTIYPMLTPMVFDNYHPFPILTNKLLIFGIITKAGIEKKKNKKLSFVQVPQNLPRFFEMEREDELVFVPIEEIIRNHVGELFRNVEIVSINLFRITRDGDFLLEEDEDVDTNFVEEIKRKLASRKTGRVVRVEAEKGYSRSMMKTLMERWRIEDINIFEVSSMIDFTGLMQIAFHENFKHLIPAMPEPTESLVWQNVQRNNDMLSLLKKQDVLLHHPFNKFDPVIELLEQAAEDENVLAIKITIYRVSKNSRITAALLKAAENGKHVSVLFEVKARFDEENNITEAKKLQKAGCFVIYGVINLKTHTKLMLIVRKDDKKITRYVHLSTGNYNESTSKIYTDLGLLTTNEVYANDVSEFFNVITGHSEHSEYQQLITAPEMLRKKLIDLIEEEKENAKKGLPSGIVLKMNSLQDNAFIEALYEASKVGVPITLIVRGICSLRPQRKNLSENIKVISLVGHFLEHSRIFYFHNNGEPLVYSGSADAMMRSFDRRIESLFLITDPLCKRQTITILDYNMRDNYNAYIMQENGNFVRKQADGDEVFNSHKEFFTLCEDDLVDTLF